MKIRNGFVSNSSSSSFVILQQNNSLSEEELIKKSSETYIKQYCSEISEWQQDNIKNYAAMKKYVILIQSIEYGAEQDVEKLAKKLCEMGNIKNVSFEWSE
ncbi:MAG: hypothetical protein WCH76_06235 [Candidatus Riflemargulisbacteria bacterium]